MELHAMYIREGKNVEKDQRGVTILKQSTKAPSGGVTQNFYVDIVTSLVPSIKGVAWIIKEKRNVRLTNYGMKGSMGISKEQEVAIKEKHREGMAAVLKVSGTYTGNDGGSLFKGKGVEDFSILDELLEMREKLNTLIHKMNRDMGLGLGKGKQACHTGFKRA